MNKFFVCLLIIIKIAPSGGLLAQAEKNYKGSDSVVAIVGTIKITADEFVNGYEYGPAFYKRAANSKNVYLDNLMREKLLSLDGLARKLDTTQTVREYYKAILDDLATEELFKDEIQSKVIITQAEIDTVAKQKLIDVELEWLYSPSKEEIMKLQDSLKKGVTFQKLFEMELNDSVSIDDRSLKSTRYQLEFKNPALGKIIDKLEVGMASIPVKVGDGWYIVRLKNFSYNLVPSETEQTKVLDEARRAVMKMKLDHLSDQYVNELMAAQKPVIKRQPFQILRSYIAAFDIPKEKYGEWKLGKILEEALDKYKSSGLNDYSKIILVELKDYKISLNDFISWYRTRAQYLKLDNRSFEHYSRSLEQIVWRMVRDKLLCSVAELKGYYTKKNVAEQSKWWLDKILYAVVKDETINSILIENKEVENFAKGSQSRSEFVEDELTKKFFYKINELKKKYNVTINEKLLSSIKVSDEENMKAIDFYTVKRGGLIPRTPYPTIDSYWARWQ